MEPQGNFLDMQTYLSDRTRPYFVLLSDLAKAFERVNPHWVLRILQILNAPVWVMQYATYVLFGRSVRHRVGRFYRHPSQYIKELTWDVRSQFCYFVSPWTPYTLF